MTPEQLAEAVLSAVRAAADSGEIAVEPPAEVRVERPRQREHGDYATNVALQLAKPARRPPREVAGVLAERLRDLPGVSQVDVAGPGFLNITLDSAAQGELARRIVEQGGAYGASDALGGLHVNLEFISANPTGPLHLGHTRWAVVGDALGRVLSAAGARVTREFYINDRGVQMDKFGASLMAAAHGRPVPDDGYHGDYVLELAKSIATDVPGILTLPEDEQLAAFREEGYRRQLAEQQQQLETLRTHFDVWYSERTLHEKGRVGHGFEVLERQGHLYEVDGALWMRTTDFGDDKDRVLVKSDGDPTYFASDTAYYVDKRERGFDVCIYLLGAD
ncbi:MAG: arginine--tRNA ligase, partial [Actinomycetota bacterium]|nr:arginine--tRNA ligase [Actinomycetota bacterium]